MTKIVPSKPDLALSIVVPAYNEEARISLTIIKTCEYLETRGESYELIVVDDGSDDRTAEAALELRERWPSLSLIEFPRNRGKGAAVRAGMLAARGRHRLFMDADLATPIRELDKLMVHARRGCDVVIGSRGLPTSDIRTRQPRAREFMGKTFNRIVRALVFDGIMDTQCGFKLFSAQAAQALFEKQQTDGFAFDVEVLLLARKLGFEVCEVPVVWYHAPNSKVSPLRDSARMFRDVIALRTRLRR